MLASWESVRYVLLSKTCYVLSQAITIATRAIHIASTAASKYNTTHASSTSTSTSMFCTRSLPLSASTLGLTLCHPSWERWTGPFSLASHFASHSLCKGECFLLSVVGPLWTTPTSPVQSPWARQQTVACCCTAGASYSYGEWCGSLKSNILPTIYCTWPIQWLYPYPSIAVRGSYEPNTMDSGWLDHTCPLTINCMAVPIRWHAALPCHSIDT